VRGDNLNILPICHHALVAVLYLVSSLWGFAYTTHSSSEEGILFLINLSFEKVFDEFKKFSFLIAKVFVVAFFSLVFFSANSLAQVLDSSFYRWTVYELQEDELSPKQCYIVSYPINSDSNQVSRKKPYFMIARFQRQRYEEVSIYGGFEYKLNSHVFVAIDDYQFQFLAGKDTAWTNNRREDVAVINSMLNSAIIKVRSDSAIGTYAIDEYSLEGITKAYARMKEICK
jgi:hypothetical protein